MIDIILAIISAIAGSVSGVTLIYTLKKIYNKKFGVSEKIEELDLKELGIKKEEKIVSYSDYIRAENDMGRLIGETKEYLCIMGISLGGLFLREHSIFMQTLKDLIRKNISIKILLLDPESDSLGEYRYLDIRATTVSDINATLSRVIYMQKIGGKVEVRLYSKAPTLSMIFNESVLLLSPYSTTPEAKVSPLMLIENKELISYFRKHFEDRWQNSKIINIEQLNHMSLNSG